MAADAAVERLRERYAAIESRLSQLEATLRPLALQRRQLDILARISKLASALGALQGDAATAPITTAAGAAAGAAAPLPPPPPSALRVTPDASPTQQRLEQELIDKRVVSSARFVRVPADYYDQPLEYRRDCLNAASIDHLCKSIVMENTRAHPSVTDWSDPYHSKYYCVIVQYTARLHADKLKMALLRLGGSKFGRQYYNMRLCPEEVNDRLTGYSHNAVSPLGLREALPIVLSHKVTQLPGGTFWLGAGEVDLKVCLDAHEFVAAYQPFVFDCTYD